MKNSINYKFWFIFLLILFHSSFLFANFHTQNDLLNKLNETTNEQVKMKIYAKLSSEIRYKDTKQSIKYIQHALDIANTLGSKNKIIKYQFQLARLHSINGEYDKSIEINHHILDSYSIINDSTFIEIHNILSLAYHGLGELNLAIKYGKKAILFGQSMDLPLLSIPSIGSLAKINMANNNYDESLSYFFQAKKAAITHNRYIQEGYINKDLAELYLYRNEYDTGIKVAKKSIGISQKYNLYIIENDARINLSRLYLKINKLDKALQTINLAINHLEEKKHIQLLLKARNAKVSILFELGKIDEALSLAHQNIIDAENNKLQKHIIEFHDDIAKMYGKKEDFKNAFFHQNKSEQLKKLLLKSEKAKIIKLAERKTNLESKDIEEQLLKTNFYNRITNTLGYSIAIMLWVGLLLILIFRKYDGVSARLENIIPLFNQSTQHQEFDFAKKVSIWSLLMILPVSFHFYYWDLSGAFYTTFLLWLMFGLIYFFAVKKNMVGIFYSSMIPYFIFTLTPILLGNLNSIPFCIMVTFIINCFLIPKKFFQIVNVSFACISSIGYFYYQTITEEVRIPFASELDLLITLIGILLIIVKISFYYKNLNKLKRQVFENNDFVNQISDINSQFIYTKNRNREFTFVNEAIANEYQIDKSRLIGKKTEDLDDFFIENPQFQEEDLAIINKGISIIKKETFIKRNGKENWFETTKKPILDKDNNIIGIYGISNNITAKKTAERKTIESEKRYRQIFNHSFDSLLVLNTDGKIIDSNNNAVTFFGFSDKETLCKNHIWKIFPHYKDQINFNEFLNSIIQEGNPIKDEAINNLNGSKIPVENTLFKINLNNEKQIVWATKDSSKKVALQKIEKEINLQKIELQRINNELVSQTISENQTNKFLKELEDSIKKIIPLTKGNSKLELNKLVRKIDAENKPNDNFYEFKLKFEKSHPNFFKKLFAINPKLTQTDLKMSAYIKLRMSSRDIANILSIEKKSVEMAKYRLKRKINLPKEFDLNIFISNL